VVGLFAVCLLAATTCQKRQIRISQQTAIVTATRAADFKPQRTQVRLVRQGLNDSYFEGWEQRRGNPLRRAWYDRAARRLEPRVNRFGYSLAPPRTLTTAAAPIAGSTQSGA